ncbi:hypothetical protein VHUM_03290 [Vanrija humicola]|uniref:AB hydrolase-1 domain-containing protein n=1 Tax=Vanrija humicola TaxID=5417 RepID=A0A7D8YX63_VANHU|nr:hypothetical protein VHUM_03290 [Vanrija humicola]
MALRPHLHLLVPSSTAAVSLEARVYLPPALVPTVGAFAAVSTSTGSRPTPIGELPSGAREALGAATRLVTAAHPWAKLGGNMLFPVVAEHVPAAVLDSSVGETALVATFNVRGVGASGGSGAWLGFGIGHDADDFAAVEAAVAGLVGRPKLYRLGYSYGTLLALNAPRPDSGVKRTMLLSPAPTLFKALTLLSGPTFAQGLDAALADTTPRALWLVYGTADDFTGADTLRGLGGADKERIVRTEIDGCGHFYARAEDAAALKAAVDAWISDE